MRRPQVNEGGYDDASAIGHADALQGNLLIVHGLADDNVHARNTLLYTEALVEKNRQFEMQVYPDDNHFLRKRNNQRHVYERLLKFLKDNL
jgi:dipeptidyl-peptidase-4